MKGTRIISVIAVVLFTTTLCHGIPNKNMPGEYDTIVVGMGAAGTVAASMLARAGKKVLALEAQDRIGGRVHTVSFGDGIAEVGAEWIHGTEGSIVYETGIENNIEILPQDIDIKVIQSDGNQIDKSLENIMNVVQYFDEDPSESQSMADLINKKVTDYMNANGDALNKTSASEILRYIKLSLETILAASSWEDLNAQSPQVEYRPGGHHYMSWHKNGYKTFFELLLETHAGGKGLSNLDIKLNTEVTKIEWPQDADGKVTITTKDGTEYKAENVIVTVSVGVLKQRAKDLFSPSLPEDKVTAIDKIQIGIIGKITFSFEEPWWPSRYFYNGFLWKHEDLKAVPADDQWTTMINGAFTPMGASNTVTMWTVGDMAKQVEVMPEETLKMKALDTLKRFTGANIPEPTAMLRSTWFSNEFTRGAYTYNSMVEAEVPTARADLAAPLNDASGKPRVLFAGEGAHTTQFSTVHGAADTGRREARRLLGTNQ